MAVDTVDDNDETSQAVVLHEVCLNVSFFIFVQKSSGWLTNMLGSTNFYKNDVPSNKHFCLLEFLVFRIDTF